MKKETLLSNEIRTVLLMTQKELATHLDIQENTISRWIKGKSLISAPMFSKLKEMGVSVNALKNPNKEV